MIVYGCGMTAPEFSANHSHDLDCYRSASLSDVLVWLGWEKHETCGGTGELDPGFRGDSPAYCPGCAFGLVPSTSMVEAAAKAIQALYNESGVDWIDETDKSFYRVAAEAALLAAFRLLAVEK